MSVTFGVKRGYTNGNHIFVATYEGKNYNIGDLDKLSTQITGVVDVNGGGGVFNGSASITIKYGTESTSITVTAMDLFLDTPEDMKTRILQRFQKIMQWKALMNVAEEFELIF